jgi:hypothetical protein
MLDITMINAGFAGGDHAQKVISEMEEILRTPICPPPISDL